MTDPSTRRRAGPPGDAFLHLEVEVDVDENSTCLVEVRGELDLATGPVLKQHLNSFLAAIRDGDQPQRVVYRLPALDFMDASGLRALLEAVDGQNPNTITIRDPSPRVRRILELVELESIIEVTDQP